MLTHPPTHPSYLQLFTIKMSDGIVATSYKPGDKFYIDPMKLLPLDRFLPRPKGAPSTPGGGRGESLRPGHACWGLRGPAWRVLLICTEECVVAAVSNE